MDHVTRGVTDVPVRNPEPLVSEIGVVMGEREGEGWLLPESLRLPLPKPTTRLDAFNTWLDEVNATLRPLGVTIFRTRILFFRRNDHCSAINALIGRHVPGEGWVQEGRAHLHIAYRLAVVEVPPPKRKPRARRCKRSRAPKTSSAKRQNGQLSAGT